MPPSKPKPAELAAEVKKTFIPHIREHYSREWPAQSILYHSKDLLAGQAQPMKYLRFAFFDRDPVDFALDWAATEGSVPVLIPVHGSTPGGDWELKVMAPEECLCRRSNLYEALTTVAPGSAVQSNYPIPSQAGLFSRDVVVFRSGPAKYEIWNNFKALPIISVSPLRRPRINTSGTYSFEKERESMRQNIRTFLRIAIYQRYHNLCVGNFGLGPRFGHPAAEVAILWKEAFLNDPEFRGHFQDVVFAFAPEYTGTGSGSAKVSTSKSSVKSPGPKSNGSLSVSSPDLQIFKRVFTPSVIHNAFQ